MYKQSKSSSKVKKDYKLGLVLNNGCARAFFQIGVLAALEDQYNFDVIVGTGIGGYIGSLIACGCPIKKIEAIARSFKPEDFIYPSKSDCCFFSNQPLLNKLKSLVGGRKIEDLSTKLVIVTADFDVNKTVIINTGSVVEAVCASIVEPGFHLPYIINNQGLSDGSMTNPLPIDVAWNNGADLILGIDTISQHLRPFDEKKDDLSFWVKNAKMAFPQLWLFNKKKIPWMEMRMLETSYTYAIDEIIETRPPNFLIQLEEVGMLSREVFIDSFDRIGELIDEGKVYGNKVLPQIRKVIDSK